MKRAIIFGGSGYIGSRLAPYLLLNGFEHVTVADIRDFETTDSRIAFTRCDVRLPIQIDLGANSEIDWIFNLAAIHREPGHQTAEYFDTNLKGATNVCRFATEIGCNNIYFASSISVYGPTTSPTSENAAQYPNTAYGVSKLIAEHINREWLASDPLRRLIIVRPGVIYGPDDPGNILRMIRAIKKGYFVLPGNGSIKKSYGYVFGLFDSILFSISKPNSLTIYNYVEKDTLTLSEMIKVINRVLGSSGKLIRVPLSVLVVIARLIYLVNPNLNGIHPDRVRKVARSTHIIPAELISQEFEFRYDFESSLEHWSKLRPSDFK